MPQTYAIKYLIALYTNCVLGIFLNRFMKAALGGSIIETQSHYRSLVASLYDETQYVIDKLGTRILIPQRLIL